MTTLIWSIKQTLPPALSKVVKTGVVASTTIEIGHQVSEVFSAIRAACAVYGWSAKKLHWHNKGLVVELSKPRATTRKVDVTIEYHGA